MTIMYPGDSQPDRVPAVFDDRVIFGYPDQSRPPPPPPPKGGGATGAVLAVFAVMLIPCAILGFLVWNLQDKISDIEAATKVEFANQIKELTEANKQLTTAVQDRDKTIVAKDGTISTQRQTIDTFNPTILALLQDRQARVARISVLLSSGDNGADQLPPRLRVLPPWDMEAVKILTKHNKELEEFEKEIDAKIAARPAPSPTPGPIGPGNPN